MYRFKESTDIPLIQVFDHTGQLRQTIRNTLAAYKKRWNESLATKLVVINSIDELIPDVPVILAAYQAHQLPSKLHPHILVPSLNELTHKHLRSLVINPVVHYTKDPVEAKQWLNSLPDLFAFDTETASLYSDEDKLQLVEQLEQTISLEEAQPIRSKLASNALVMAKNQTTMYSFSISESEAFVIDANEETNPIVLDFLTSTDSTVVMHNAMYDMRLVYNRTGKFIKHYEDTQLMWATIKNNTNSFLSKVGLKELAKEIYKEWAISQDFFGIEHKYNPELIKYSGTDSMATLYLFNEAQLKLKDT